MYTKSHLYSICQIIVRFRRKFAYSHWHPPCASHQCDLLECIPTVSVIPFCKATLFANLPQVFVGHNRVWWELLPFVQLLGGGSHGAYYRPGRICTVGRIPTSVLIVEDTKLEGPRKCPVWLDSLPLSIQRATVSRGYIPSFSSSTQEFTIVH